MTNPWWYLGTAYAISFLTVAISLVWSLKAYLESTQFLSEIHEKEEDKPST